ncbi:MAG: family 10 glycosylhydrolase [Defluviitaleaceae bacterium]|nr:family 10 glycosylhydrolase [Defluviitaleaceae bacterium]
MKKYIYLAVLVVILATIAVACGGTTEVESVVNVASEDSGDVANDVATIEQETGAVGETVPAYEEAELETEAEIIWHMLPEYIPAELSYPQQLNALITYARNRYDWAAAEGANIQTGRHPVSAMRNFSNAIQAAEAFSAEYNENGENENLSDSQTREATETLHRAIETFRNTIIDPYGRYRPFLETIAHGEDVPQKHHLRAAWIATVLNIDWPSAQARGTTPAHVDLQKYELRQRFDEIADLGFNAVVFQISPTGDAFFRSEISPWSAWLTGETNFTGELLDSNGEEFDPLEYVITLARARNIEVHAWFNPYRITHTIGNYRDITLSSTGERVTSLSQIRDEWSGIPNTAFYLFGDYVKLGENRYVVDPAAPMVRDWIVQRVLEVVENFDIDAVHFDDYFYPANFPITDTFARYNTPEHNWVSNVAFPNTNQGLADWRRENTEMMIRDVGAAIRETAPWVKFGISPGGVWKSAAEGNTGLDGGGYNAGTGSASTTTWSNYHSSFADTRRWVVENLIDYLTPQVYWEWTHSTAPYGVISEWWARLFEDFGLDGHLRNSLGEYTNAQLFIGVGLYRMDNTYRSAAVTVPHKWRNSAGFEYEGMRTLLRQEAYNLGHPHISGSMLFSQHQMRPDRGHGMRTTMETLHNTMWRYAALVPPMPHLGGTAPSPPANIIIADNIISWKNTEISTSQLQAPRYFVIYHAPTENININNPANILAIVPAIPNQVYYFWELPENVTSHHFAVTAVNRLHDESRPSGGTRN